MLEVGPTEVIKHRAAMLSKYTAIKASLASSEAKLKAGMHASERTIVERKDTVSYTHLTLPTKDSV